MGRDTPEEINMEFPRKQVEKAKVKPDSEEMQCMEPGKA